MIEDMIKEYSKWLLACIEKDYNNIVINKFDFLYDAYEEIKEQITKVEKEMLQSEYLSRLDVKTQETLKELFDEDKNVYNKFNARTGRNVHYYNNLVSWYKFMCEEKNEIIKGLYERQSV